MKRTTICEMPVLNRSGYGKMSDDYITSLLKNPKLDIGIIPSQWGNCVGRGRKDKNDELIISKLITKQVTEQPDIYCSATIPNLVKPKGRFNINFTAGIEVDRCYDQIIHGVNSVDLTICCSQFAKNNFLNSNVKVTKPIEVVYWGADTNVFKPDAPSKDNVNKELDIILEQQVFLFVGQNTHPKLFSDRKDMDGLIKSFCELFANVKNAPALLLKTSGTNFSTFDRNQMLEKIASIKQLIRGDLPSVYLLHGELSDEEMAALYTHPKIVANISFTHGEGFGGPLLQSSLCGKPTFASNWSAHTEYLTDSRFMLEGDIVALRDDLVSEYFVKGSNWFQVDYEKAKTKIVHFLDNIAEYNKAALELGAKNSKEFSLNKIDYRLNKVINKYCRL